MKTKLENMCKWVIMGFSPSERKSALETLLEIDFPGKVVNCNTEKPCTGRVFGVKELRDIYRINYRCGYGRYNYAPCIEIMK